MNQLRGIFHKDRNAYIASNSPGIFHCHHYNCYLQACLLDTSSYLPGIREDVLVNSAHEIVHPQFAHYFAEANITDINERKAIVEDYFRFCGFGIIKLADINKDGGEFSTHADHYGIGWKSKFGNNEEPVSFFTRGFLSGAVEAIFDLEMGSMDCQQTQCIAMGHFESTFALSPATEKKNFIDSPKEGAFQTGELQDPESSPVNYTAIRDALIGMPLEGGAESGLIDAFGVMLTRHYANYYCLISYKVLRLFEKHMGENGSGMARELLIEAGHVCAFNTFGGIMQSNEWNAMIKPMFQTKEDWVDGIVAVVNALGWGFWTIEEHLPNEKLKVSVKSGYEANSYVKTYGSDSEYPVSYLATGGVAGIMNLIYTLNLDEKAPMTLDTETYNSIHRNKNFFTTEQVSCRAMSNDHQEDVFVATVK